MTHLQNGEHLEVRLPPFLCYNNCQSGRSCPGGSGMPQPKQVCLYLWLSEERERPVWESDMEFQITSPVCFCHENNVIHCKNDVLWNVDKLGKSITAANISLVADYAGNCIYCFSTNPGDLISILEKEREALQGLMDPIPKHIAERADQTLDSRHSATLFWLLTTQTPGALFYMRSGAWSFPSYFVFSWKQEKKP